MSDIAIKLENISKRYRLGLVGTNTLRGDLQAWWYRMRGLEDPTLRIGEENRLDKAGGDYIWALRDINLDVKQGEILGIIGKNGAGKSTLLKLLSRVTGPTTGQIKVNGRIASLLEVGTGFHPELTGRENIFLNGAILGMTKNDIRRKLDEIVDFAGVAKYLETPVKRYSSGMYVRLAFAVAAHLEPDILVVDEVLAVGDAEFQKKAIGKMKDVSKGGGRTVLFVSHNMGSIQKLCKKAVVLSQGKIVFFGQVDEAIDLYLSGNDTENVRGEIIVDNYIKLERTGTKRNGKIEKVSILNKKGKVSDTISINDNFTIQIEADLFDDFKNPEFGAVISNKKGERLHHFVSTWMTDFGKVKKGKVTVQIDIDSIQLYPSSYKISVWYRAYRTGSSDDFVENVLNLEIINSEKYKYIPFNDFKANGGVLKSAKWKLL